MISQRTYRTDEASSAEEGDQMPVAQEARECFPLLAIASLRALVNIVSVDLRESVQHILDALILQTRSVLNLVVRRAEQGRRVLGEPMGDLDHQMYEIRHRQRWEKDLH